ncbi:hypothetical protein Tco_1415630, partial [Tanacetum coccineum]
MCIMSLRFSKHLGLKDSAEKLLSHGSQFSWRLWKKQHIKNVEKDLGEVDHELPKTSVPRTDVGFFRVTKKDTTAYWRASIPIDV